MPESKYKNRGELKIRDLLSENGERGNLFQCQDIWNKTFVLPNNQLWFDPQEIANEGLLDAEANAEEKAKQPYEPDDTDFVGSLLSNLNIKEEKKEEEDPAYQEELKALEAEYKRKVKEAKARREAAKNKSEEKKDYTEEELLEFATEG